MERVKRLAGTPKEKRDAAVLGVRGRPLQCLSAGAPGLPVRYLCKRPP